MHRGLRQLKVLATITVGAAVLGTAASATSVASEPVVHVYDVQVTGTHRTTLSLPNKPLPLDFAYSQTSKWTETYKGVRLEVRTTDFGEPTVDMRNESWLPTKGTVKGSIKYTLSGPRIKKCVWSTNRSEPGSMLLSGRSSSPAQINFTSGRRTDRQPLRPSNCAYYEANLAKFAGARIGPGEGIAAGYIDTRAVRLLLEFGSPQKVGQLEFPLSPLEAGTGFALSVKGKTKDQAGRHTSEGTVRITFVPRPS